MAERSWTHGETHDLAARAAGVLAGQGVQSADRVVVALPDGIGWVVTFLAVARLGAVAVTVNPALTAADHVAMAETCGATLAVTEAVLAGHFGDCAWLDIQELLGQARTSPPAPPQAVGPRAPLYVQFTSGTTGRPKGALHRHGDPAAYYRSVAIPVVEIDRPDVTLSISKLFFAYGFGNALVFPLFSGSAAVLIAGAPTPQAVQELAVRHRVSVLYAVPSAYANLVAEASPEAFGSVRVAVSAGESLAIGLGERASALLGAPVLDQLGSTEAGHAFCSNTLAGNVPGTIGTPLPGYQLELRDADGNVLGEESDGALWLRGPTLMSQYLNLPEATAEVLVDGWLRTADRAVRHPDQTYTHIGRTDDMEMVGGITVAPLEIERVLSEHADVSEVAVAAVPDERGATKLLAFVVTYRADRPRPELEAELTALARARLARYKVPRAVRFVDALPRTPTGKLRRFIVRQGSW